PSRRWPLLGRSKMLLELEDLCQEIVCALEDLFHRSVPVTVLEALAAAAVADVITSDASEVQRRWAAERQSGRGGRRSAARFRGRRRLRDILRAYRVGS